jgi:hypothetical protein
MRVVMMAVMEMRQHKKETTARPRSGQSVLATLFSMERITISD